MTDRVEEIVMMRSFLLCFLLVVVNALAEEKFSALAIDYHALAKLVDRLDAIILKDVNFKDVEFLEAMDQLQKRGSRDPKNSRGGTGGTGVINFFVRKNRTDGEEKPEPKVSLSEKSISFAAAVDAICREAGYRWRVDLSKGVPYMHIEGDPG